MENKLINLLGEENLVFVNITTEYLFEIVAQNIKKIFDNFDFLSTDIYHEFPGFEGVYKDYNLVLFGIPEGGIDTLNRKIYFYQLRIISEKTSKSIDELINVSDKFSKIFTEITGIKSFPVE